MQQPWRQAAFVVGAAVGLSLVLSVTRGHPGWTVDSGEYLGAAKSLLHGHGLTLDYVNADEAFKVPTGSGQETPLTQFPPVFPVLIAAVAWLLSCSVLTAAGVVVVASFAWTAGRLTQVAARRSGGHGLVMLGLIGLVPVVQPALMAWTESVKLLVLVEAALATGAFVVHGRRRTLVLLCVLCAVAPLIHLTGVAAGLSAALVIGLGRDDTRPRARWPAALTVLASTLIPFGAWLIYGSLSNGGVSQKHLGWYPTTETGLLWATALAALAGALVYRNRSDVRAPSFVFPTTALVSIGCLLASRTIVDRNIALDRRQLQGAAVLAAAGAVLSLSQHARVRRLLPVVAVAALLAGPGVTFASAAGLSRSEFLGYAAPRWKHSSLLDEVRRRPSSWTLTNAPDAVALLTAAKPIGLPQPKVLYSGEPNAKYPSQLADLRCAAAGHHPVLAFFYRPTRGHARVIDPALVTALRLRAPIVFSDGILYDVGTDGC